MDPDRRRGALLNDVDQLVREQAPPRGGLRVVATRSEEDVILVGEGLRVQAAAQRRRLRIGVDPDAGEAGAEGGLHLAADRLWKLGATPRRALDGVAGRAGG